MVLCVCVCQWEGGLKGNLSTFRMFEIKPVTYKKHLTFTCDIQIQYKVIIKTGDVSYNFFQSLPHCLPIRYNFYIA